MIPTVSTLPAIGFTLTITNNLVLVPVDDIAYGVDAVPPPTNCRSIIVYNMDATNRIFIKFEQTAVIVAATMTVLNSTVLPALGSITFAVNYLGDRPNLYMAGNYGMYLKAEAGTNLPVNITYLQGRGTQLL